MHISFTVVAIHEFRSTCWVWWLCSGYSAVLNTLKPLTRATLTLHDTVPWFDHSASHSVQNVEHVFLFSHHPSIPPSMPPAADYTCSVACLWPSVLWIRVPVARTTPTQTRTPHMRFTHGHTQNNSNEPMHTKESRTDTKDTAAHNKCEICESDFVIQATTHFSYVSG